VKTITSSLSTFVLRSLRRSELTCHGRNVISIPLMPGAFTDDLIFRIRPAGIVPVNDSIVAGFIGPESSGVKIKLKRDLSFNPRSHFLFFHYTVRNQYTIVGILGVFTSRPVQSLTTSIMGRRV
jgi:hypothetical protein